MAFPTASEIARIGQMQQQNSPLAQLGRLVAGGFQGYQAGQERKAEQAKAESEQQAQQGAAQKQAKAASLIQQAVQNPDQAEVLVAQAATLDPEFVNKVFQARKAGAGSYQQGDNGLVFNTETGTYKVDEKAKEILTKKAEQKAAEGVKLGVKDIQGINKDVTGLIKGVNDITQSAKSLDSLKSSSSPAAKLAAVFKFMKANDPTSVVRESEQGQVYEAQGAAKQLAGKLNSLIGEGQLSDEGFQDLVDTAKLMANSAIESSNQEINSYLDVYGDTIPSDFKSKIIGRIPKALDRAQAKQTGSAPKAAIDYLMSNPQAKADFKAKYGYIPEGI